MAKMFIPKVGDLIRITDDVTIPLQATPGSRLTPDTYSIWSIVHPDRPWDYFAAKTIDKFTLVKGTVLKFKRLFVSAHARQNAIEVSIFAHPDERLMPRAQGGKAKSTIAFTLSTDQVNLIDYEKVEL